MRKLLIACIGLFVPLLTYSQTKPDLQGFIKVEVEARAPLENYNYMVSFGSDDILKTHAEAFVGQPLSWAEFERLMFFDTEIYTDSRKSVFLTDVVLSLDLKGLETVDITRKNHKGIDYYELILFMNQNYIAAEYSEGRGRAERINPIRISIDATLSEAQNILGAIILLAEKNDATVQL